jgi:hypothetical protein
LDSNPTALEKIGKLVDERTAINLATTSYFDASKYEIEKETVDYDKIVIKPLAEAQEKITSKTNEVQKMIEKTKSDLIYPGR